MPGKLGSIGLLRGPRGPAGADGAGGGGAAMHVATLALARALNPVPSQSTQVFIGSDPIPWVVDLTSGAGFDDDGETVLEFALILNASNGRLYHSAAHLPTVAALRLTSGTHKIVHVRSYRTQGDGGGDLFAIDTADTTTADDGGNVIVNALGIRYKRIRSGPAMTHHYGMVDDGKHVLDATILASSTSLFSPTAVFKAGQVVHLMRAKFYNLTGTVATTNGSRGVAGTGTSFEDQLWEGALCTFVGHAGTFKVTTELSGTVSYGSANAHWVGTGTKWATELHAGAIVRARGGINASSSRHPLAFLRQVLASPGITDTTLDVNAPAPDRLNNYASISGARHSWFWRGDFTDLGGGVRASQARVLVTPAPTFTASGMTMRGPARTLTATIVSVSPDGHTAALDTAADVAVTNGLCYYGTPNDTAWNNLIANNDHVHVSAAAHAKQTTTTGRLAASPGSYVFLGGPAVTGSQAHRHITWSNGAQFITGGTFLLNSPGCTVDAPGMGTALGGGQGIAFNYAPHIRYCGPYRKPIVQIADGSYSTSAGTGIRGLRVEQVCDVTTDDSDLLWEGTGGVTGFEIGTHVSGSGQSADNAFVLQGCVTHNCYDGFIVNGGTQEYVLRDCSVQRYNAGQDPQFSQAGTRSGTFVANELLTQAVTGYSANCVSSTSTTLDFISSSQMFDASHVITGGTSGATFTPSLPPTFVAGPYSRGIAIGVGCNMHYRPSTAACTAGRIEGQTLLHSHKTFVQICNPYNGGSQVATTDITRATVEGMHPEEGCYFRIFASGRTGVFHVHAENTSSMIDFSPTCFELGSPATNGAALQFSARYNRMSLAGGGIAVAAYQWAGFRIEENLLDLQEFATNESKIFADLSGGAGLRRGGIWGQQLDASAGVANDPLEIWPNGDQVESISGITRSESWNIDAAGVLHVSSYDGGKARFDRIDCPRFSGINRLFDQTDINGTFHVGEDASTISTTTTNFASGANHAGGKLVSVASTTDLKPGAKIDINPGGTGDELVVVARILNAVELETETPLANDHADGVPVRYGLTAMVLRGYFNAFMPSEVGPSWSVDRAAASFTVAPLTATSSITERWAGFDFVNAFYESTGGGASRARTERHRSRRISATSPFRTETYWEYNGVSGLSIDDDGVVYLGSSGDAHPVSFTKGSGSPEGVVTASPSSHYHDWANGEEYTKVTGTGNTGWKKVTHEA